MGSCAAKLQKRGKSQQHQPSQDDGALKVEKEVIVSAQKCLDEDAVAAVGVGADAEAQNAMSHLPQESQKKLTERQLQQQLVPKNSPQAMNNLQKIIAAVDEQIEQGTQQQQQLEKEKQQEMQSDLADLAPRQLENQNFEEEAKILSGRGRNTSETAQNQTHHHQHDNQTSETTTTTNKNFPKQKKQQLISTHESGIMLRVFEPTEESAIDVFAVPPIDDVLNEEEDDEKENLSEDQDGLDQKNAHFQKISNCFINHNRVKGMVDRFSDDIASQDQLMMQKNV